MTIDSKNNEAPAPGSENTNGWKWLYLIVVGVLVAQIAFFAWFTKAFA